MNQAVPDILAKIIGRKRLELERPWPAGLEELAADSVQARRDFRRVLVAREPAVIAEMKKASPSKGVFVEDFDPAKLALQFAEGGAAALSVLTDEQFFHGSLSHLADARLAAVSLPVLRKDFTIDERQIVESAAAGADAILLITALLSVAQLRHFREVASQYKIACIVEVHNEEEQKQAVDSGAEVIGVNNRDLRTFEVDLGVSLRLAEKMPGSAVTISESGIHSRADIDLLRAAGYSAFLVGEHLMKSGDPVAALKALTA